MTKTATRPGPAPKPNPAGETTDAAKREKPKESFRDIVEQVVVAILLAVLIRGFDVEAFVIPTGSMAPTLKGRHKEVTCPQCRNVFAVNSSEDADLRKNPRERQYEMGICVNCRFLVPIGGEPSFKGDRILVMKFPYEFPTLPGAGGPDRWDVVVFHYPVEPEVNYIKRLVGLSDEDLRLHRGNIYVRPGRSNDPFQIVRKPLSRQQAMSILVNDDTRRPTLLKDRPEWQRWQPIGRVTEPKPGVFSIAAGPQDAGSLRYRHLVPDPEQWEAIAAKDPLPRAPRATLITDFYSYNATTMADANDKSAAWLQSDWVGDLTLEFDLRVEKAEGDVSFELVEAGVKNRCVIDLKTGVASLFHGQTKLGEAPTRITGLGRYSVGFANVDDRLTLWVDGRTPFGDGLVYDDAPGTTHGPTAADLDPAGIAASGTSIEVSGLVLKRDIYYTLNPSRPDGAIDYPRPRFEERSESKYARVLFMFDVLSDPAKFGPIIDDVMPGETYTIKPGHFLMMGDNSPRSADSRAWGNGDRDWDVTNRSRWEVPRALLIGRAFFVYWPHGVPFWPKIQVARDFLIPFRPYFERMKPIR